MLRPDASRLEVWGDPVAHSRSPQLHAAAYAVLGRNWTYSRRQVGERGFAAELAGLSGQFRGLSLTMPLKGVAFEAAARRDRNSELTGAVNTLLLDTSGHRGFNTDVGGLVRALAEVGVDRAESARIVGAGATATSALVALAGIGVTRVEVVARRPSAVEALARIGEKQGLQVVAVPFSHPFGSVPLTIATLPGDAAVPPDVADALASSGGTLFDVVYGHWPTALSAAWERVEARAVSGLAMLLHQALLQVRVFVGGDPEASLPDEAAVLAAMRSSIMGD